MSDPELGHEILINIMIAISRIERRFEGVTSPDQFVTDDFGIDRLDGITMMLIAIGEQIKRLDAMVDFDLSEHYADVDWCKGYTRFSQPPLLYGGCRNHL